MTDKTTCPKCGAASVKSEQEFHVTHFECSSYDDCTPGSGYFHEDISCVMRQRDKLQAENAELREGLLSIDCKHSAGVTHKVGTCPMCKAERLQDLVARLLTKGLALAESYDIRSVRNGGVAIEARFWTEMAAEAAGKDKS